MKQFSDVNCQRGAQMGRNSYGTAAEAKGNIKLFKVRMVDECYDDGGAYWGGPSNLYCARDDQNTYRAFIRASSYKQAHELLGLPN